MSNDWKSDLKKTAEERDVRLETEEQLRLQERINNHKRKFFCHICGRQSEKTKELPNDLLGSWPGWGVVAADLGTCSICKKQTCFEHLASVSNYSVCERCAQNKSLVTDLLEGELRKQENEGSQGFPLVLLLALFFLFFISFCFLVILLLVGGGIVKL
ncbi:hypothetical protein HYS03_00430 [Candidatus Woesebacteria bacterium]|nr:hypothetical protein [Candidatus Woesebacteria bacterium]QQG47645.1 MAG: hypothetical protein HY044_00985 [Candidatus Woesebacteria bacterium]